MGGKRVLIVDDAQFMRNILREILSGLGWTIAGEAADGQEAIEQFSALKPDLVTMDMVMPKLSGVEAIKGILKHEPKAKVLVVSAIDQKDVLKEALVLGAVDFIVKPFDAERIATTLKKSFAGA